MQFGCCEDHGDDLIYHALLLILKFCTDNRFPTNGFSCLPVETEDILMKFIDARLFHESFEISISELHDQAVDHTKKRLYRFLYRTVIILILYDCRTILRLHLLRKLHIRLRKLPIIMNQEYVAPTARYSLILLVHDIQITLKHSLYPPINRRQNSIQMILKW